MHRRIPQLVVLLAALLVVAAPVAPAQAVAPSPTGLPVVSGQARAGQNLSSTNGTFTGTAPMTYTRRWARCDEDGAGCQTITGASNPTYPLVEADVGATVRVVVTATNLDGSATATSAPSPVVAPRQPPVNTVAPALSGTARDGQALTVTNGTWTGTATIAYARKWQRCDALGADCVDIGGQSGVAYTLTSNDFGRTIRAQVIATNPDGTGFAMSAASAVVEATAPANTVLPSTAGTTREGQTLRLGNPGTWSGTTPMTYSRQWERCSAAGTACAPIDGAVGTDHVLTAADVGLTLRVVVTATNAKTSTSAASATTPAIAPKAPPANTVAPSIGGTTTDSNALTGANGTWTGTSPITYARKWLRCDATGAGCLPIASQTGATYTLTPADVDRTLRLEVTATNPDGTTTTASAPTAQIAPLPPSFTAAPAVTGTTREGQVLSASTGTWKGTPALTYSWQWHRCSGAVCDAITGATNQTYRLTPDDVGKTMRAVVQASNDGGAVTAWSPSSGVVTAGPPANTAPPEISGALARDGQLWSGTLGGWVGTAPLLQERQWVRCPATGTGVCTVISGAVDATYRLTSADVGKTIKLQVKTLNAHGELTVQSAASPVVAATPPTPDAPPAVSGDLRDGGTVGASGTWGGTTPIALTYAWERCDAIAPTCAPIPNATAATYVLTPADVGARVRVRVGASNAGGGASATSDPSGVVARDPARATGTPSLTGTAREGEILTAGTTTFSGTAPLTYAVQWQRCDDQGEGCGDIPGATGTQRVLTAADRGSTLRALVTASNSAGSDTATTPLSAVVAMAPPRGTILPAVTPNTGLKDGRLLTATEGAWAGSEPMELAYRWQRCAPAGTGCTPIEGAGESTYRLVTADVGHTVRVVVTAVNGAGSATQASVVTGVVGTNPPVNDSAPTISGVAQDGDELRVDEGTWSGLVPFTTTFKWWRCDAGGEDCAEIPGATGSVYRLGHDDVDLTVRAQVVQANAGGSTGVMSAPSAVVIPAPPTNVVVPQVLGGAAVGKLLTADPGQWHGTPELVYAYQWQRCAADGSACADIPGATASSYLLTMADDEQSVQVVVTATNALGSETATSPSSAEISDDPPVAVTQPTIETDGLWAHGTVLTVQTGGWAGAQPMTQTVQWRRCDIAGTGCVDIAGAIDPAYVLTAQDVGKRLRARVTAENVVSATVAETSLTPTILPEPPANVLPPVITAAGAMRDGVKLTATTGTWTGAPPMAYTTTWLRCDADGDTCQEIADVMGTSYTLTSADVGARIRARVVAANVATEVARDSAPTSAIGAALPVNAGRPSVVALDGKARVGARVRAVTGTWNGTAPMDLEVQWQRCIGSSVAACDDIPGATATDYTLGEPDVGRRVRVIVIAENAAGTARADSNTTEAVPAVAPENLSPPTVSGGAVREGTELTATAGSWIGSAPVVYAYQWERCPNTGAPTCPKIAGATRQTYTAVAADVGKRLRVSVTASNAGGRLSVAGTTSDEVGGVLPVNTDIPAIVAKGGTKVGGTLTATTGKWGGTAPMTYATRWQRCDPRGLACTDIPSATKNVFALKAEDLDGDALKAPIRAVITATNVAGSVDAGSAALGATLATAAAAPADGGTVRTRKTKKKTPKSKVLATLRRVRIDSKGQLLFTLTCAKKAKDRCGTIGSFASGKAFSGSLSLNGIAKGRTVTHKIVLKPKQRKALRGKRAIRLLLRMAPPATPTRAKARHVRVAVPKTLSGRIKAAKKKKLTATQRAAAKRRAAKKRAAAKRP